MAFGKTAAKAASRSVREDPDEKTLESVRAVVRRARDLQLEISSLSEQMARKQEELTGILSKKLPGTFGDLGIDTLGLEAEGNMPAYDARKKPYYHAVLPRDPALRKLAVVWLEKHKHGDIIKTTITAALGMGERRKAKQLIAALKKLKVEYQGATDVPWGTLTALVRELIERGVTPPLETLGATVGTVVELKPRKEVKRNGARGGSD